jgi:hypothetical protein
MALDRFEDTVRIDFFGDDVVGAVQLRSRTGNTK